MTNNRWTNYNPEQAFWENVKAQNDCLVWTGTQDKDGYGVFGSKVLQRRGWGKRAHKLAWLITGHEIPDGYVLDHTCRNRLCVKPQHLEPVTPLENTRRGGNARKTHCAKGHKFTPNNTYVYTKEKHGRNKRVCRTCARVKR